MAMEISSKKKMRGIERRQIKKRRGREKEMHTTPGSNEDVNALRRKRG